MAPASSKSTFQFFRSAAARSRAFGERSALRDSGRTAAFTGASRGARRSRGGGGAAALAGPAPRVQPQQGAGVDAALGVGRLVLGVGLDQERHERAGQPRRGL